MVLVEAIQKYKKSKRILFTTPGHNLGKVIPDNIKKLLGKEVFRSDLSEIEDFDNIRNPKSLFLESQKKAADIYGSKASFYLFNGSSSGITALMLSCLKENDKVLLVRNSHTSVYNGLILTGAHPVWVTPEYDNDWNIYKAINADKVKEKLIQNPDIKAVIITSPTYEGVVSKIKKIADVCKEHDVILIVDEAHGALWNFSDKFRDPAIKCGADASVQSLHKTATALTQGAITHIAKDSKICPDKLQKALNIVNSTSPSYPILASVEAAVEYLDSQKGRKRLSELLNNIEQFRQSLEDGNIEIYHDKKYDPTKLLIKINGVSGHELSNILMDKFEIEDELCNDTSILAVTTIATDKKKLNKLKKALEEVVDDETLTFKSESHQRNNQDEPFVALTPRQAYFKDSIEVDKSDCIGKVCAELILTYPPGIPLIMPGERIKSEHLEFFKDKDVIKIVAN